MTVKALAVVQPSNNTKISNERSVIVMLDRKNEKSYKFDAVYNYSSMQELHSSHISKVVGNILSGLDSSLVIFRQSPTGYESFLSGEESMLSLLVKGLFLSTEKVSSRTEFLISVSMMQMTQNGQCTDLISPHGRRIVVKPHYKDGLYVEGLSQLLCNSAEDVKRLHEDGCQVASALKLKPCLTYFIIRVLSRPAGNTTPCTSACVKFVEFSATASNLSSVSSVLNTIVQKKGKLGNSASGRPVVDEIMLDALLGNGHSYAIASVGGTDAGEAQAVLSVVEPLSGLGTNAKVNRNDNEATLHQLRQEISKVRNRLASQSPPNRDDLSLMEKLMSDLDETKRTGWDQTILRSEQFFEERKSSFSNKGLLWILEATKTASRENIQKLDKLKTKLKNEYKNQRHITDRLNTELKQKIDSYTQLINSGSISDNDKKGYVAGITELKEQHKTESDKLKDVQNKLREVENKLQNERKAGVEENSSSFAVAFQAMMEERERTKQENEQLVEEELEKMKTEVEHEKADLQVKFSSQTLNKSSDEILKSETELVQLRSEMSVITTQLDCMKRERAQFEEHTRLLAEKHSRELEIQQLQNLQTFRAYREVFEEFKVELENRWRSLLDDTIQDAVFLNARNTELMETNARLKFEIANLKDARSLSKGKSVA